MKHSAHLLSHSWVPGRRRRPGTTPTAPRAAGFSSTLLLFAVLSATACSEPHAQSAAAPEAYVAPSLGFLRDSAGMRVDATPTVPAFHDGEWIFIDAESQSASWYDSTGLFLGTFGRRGGGPGEFWGLQSVVPLGPDTVALFDDTRRVAYVVKERKRIVQTVSFNGWPIEFLSGDQLVGRTGDGRWIALTRTKFVPRRGVIQEVVDSPTLVAGRAGEAPLPLLILPKRRVAFYATTRSTGRIHLNDVAPAVFSVCRSGIVYADTSGVHVYDLKGNLKSHWRAPVQRYPLRARDKHKLLERILSGYSLENERDRALSIMQTWIASSDSIMNTPMIDSNGAVWFSHVLGGKTTHFGIAPDGSSLRPMQLSGVYAMGAGTALGISLEADDLSQWELRRTPEASIRMQHHIGPCGSGVTL